MKAACFIHGMNLSSTSGFLSQGRIGSWKERSFIDVLGDKNKGLKLELRNTAFEEDGSHSAEIDSIFFIASACMQYLQARNGVKTSPSGAVMAEIFQAFSRDVERLQFAPDQAVAARQLLSDYTRKIKEELGYPIQ
jgi:hypothetical protein